MKGFNESWIYFLLWYFPSSCNFETLHAGRQEASPGPPREIFWKNFFSWNSWEVEFKKHIYLIAPAIISKYGSWRVNAIVLPFFSSTQSISMLAWGLRKKINVRRLFSPFYPFLPHKGGLVLAVPRQLQNRQPIFLTRFDPNISIPPMDTIKKQFSAKTCRP